MKRHWEVCHKKEAVRAVILDTDSYSTDIASTDTTSTCSGSRLDSKLQTAVTVAKASTASLGKFQDKLPKEKEARGVAAITPGATRKRKLPPVSGTVERSENLAIVESILNKKPKLDIEKAVARHINNEQVERSQEKQNSGQRSSKSKGRGNAKKPKGGKGERKGKTGGGRKRR